MSAFSDWLSARLDSYRLALAGTQADGFLAALGLLSGVLAGLLIVAFRLLTGALQSVYMGDLPGEAFEFLDVSTRFALPTVGGLLIGLAYWWLPQASRTVGIVHVLERLHYHQGHLPWRNVVVQFVGGAVALASGQSVGREAPSVHLGAGAASILARRLQLPNNAIRTLVACGTAAAIAASFNTPLAGVVFAMEVIMVEYTIAGFVPVILAAVSATAVTRAVFGAETVFLVPLTGLASLWELLYILAMGATIGLISAAFVNASRLVSGRATRLPIVAQMSLGGALVGSIAAFVPEVMGLGYDTVRAVLGGQIGLLSLLIILLAKFAASVVCSAVRMPGGLIGPTVVMGCLIGAVFTSALSSLPGVSSSAAMFVMLGMAALMGAVLQAPLAALLALLEMTGNPLIILPAMLAVVSAALTARIVCRQESVFTHQMRDGGFDYRHDPMSQGLRRVGVAAVMNRNFEHAERHLSLADSKEILRRGPQWLVFEHSEAQTVLLLAADLARFVQKAEAPPESVDLLSIPAERLTLQPIHLQASLYEARETMLKAGVEALLVRRPLAPMTYRSFGILLRADLETSYQLTA